MKLRYNYIMNKNAQDKLINALVLYEDNLSKNKDMSRVFGIFKLPRFPIIFSFFNIILIGFIESIYGTYFIVPIMALIFSSEILRLDRIHTFIISACIDAEFQFPEMIDEDRSHLLNQLIDGIKRDRQSFVMNIISSVLTCAAFFIASYTLANSILY